MPSEDESAGTGPSPAAVREALERVCASEGFRKAPQLAAFLRYVVERTLAGDAASLKGYSIATEALGRGPDFDPQSDPIVRVEAGRLRRTLDGYYAGPGSDDPVLITVPRGSYVPRFQALRPGPAASEPPAVFPASETQPKPDIRPARRIPRPIAATGAILALVLLSVAALLIWRGEAPSPAGPVQAAERQRIIPPPAPLVTPGAMPPSLVVAPVETAGTHPAWFSPPGLREALLNALARFDELVVLEREQTTTSPGQQRYALTVRVGQRQSGVVASARLTHLDSGQVIWSREFGPVPPGSEPNDDEAEVARLIAALAQPGGVLFADLRQRHGSDPGSRCLAATYDYWRSPSEPLHAEVRACLEAGQAGATSHLTQAYLAYIYLEEWRLRFNPRTEPLDRAWAAARRSVELGPESARAHQALMNVLFVRGEVAEALAIGRRALAINPHDADVLANVGARLVQAGQPREGLDLLRRAEAASPAAPGWYLFHSFVAALMIGEADRAMATASRIDPTEFRYGHLARAIAALRGNRAEEALGHIEALAARDASFASDPSGSLRRRLYHGPTVDRLLAELKPAGYPLDPKPASK